MFIYIKELASKIGVHMINKFKELVNEYNSFSNNLQEINSIQNYAYQVPIIGFNSGTYDINMVKSFNFFNHIYENKIKLYLKVMDRINYYRHKIIGF